MRFLARRSAVRFINLRFPVRQSAVRGQSEIPSPEQTRRRIPLGLSRRGVHLPQAAGASFWPDDLLCEPLAEIAGTRPRPAGHGHHVPDQLRSLFSSSNHCAKPPARLPAKRRRPQKAARHKRVTRRMSAAIWTATPRRRLAAAQSWSRRGCAVRQTGHRKKRPTPLRNIPGAALARCVALSKQSPGWDRRGSPLAILVGNHGVDPEQEIVLQPAVCLEIIPPQLGPDDDVRGRPVIHANRQVDDFARGAWSRPLLRRGSLNHSKRVPTAQQSLNL